MELQYDDVWAILGIDGSLQENVESAISATPEVFTWIKSELGVCQTLSGFEDAGVVESCDLNCPDIGTDKDDYFYAATIRGSHFDRYPTKGMNEFVVFFTRQKHSPYRRTGLVFSTNDLLLYVLRVVRVISLLRKWTPDYSPDLNRVLGNAFDWFYKTKVHDDLSFDISSLREDLLKEAIANNYLNIEQMTMTLKGDVFLSEHGCNMTSLPQPPPPAKRDDDLQNHDMPAGQTEKDWEEGYYPPSILAKHYGLQTDTARKRLDQYRNTHIDGFQEVENRRRNEPKYLYQAKAVKGILSQ